MNNREKIEEVRKLRQQMYKTAAHYGELVDIMLKDAGAKMAEVGTDLSELWAMFTRIEKALLADKDSESFEVADSMKQCAIEDCLVGEEVLVPMGGRPVWAVVVDPGSGRVDFKGDIYFAQIVARPVRQDGT